MLLKNTPPSVSRPREDTPLLEGDRPGPIPVPLGSLRITEYACPLQSANPAYHELLLTVLWYGVVHTSALVRCTAARMFEVSGQIRYETRRQVWQ